MLAVTEKCTFADLCAKKHIPYSHGCGFYQLASSETVSMGKLLVATNEDSGEIVAGSTEVRAKLKLGAATALKPAMVPSPWTLYVNSTSSNRGLKPKTTVMIKVGGADIVDLVQDGEANEEAKSDSDTPKTLKTAAPPKSPRKAAPAKKRQRSVTPEPDDDEEEAPRPMKKAEPEAKKPAAKVCAVKTPSTAVTAPILGGKWTQRDADGWVWDGTLMARETIGDLTPTPGDKIAAFDYDGCLANTSLFKKGPDAWSLLFPTIPQCLKELLENGYRLVIMSNQAAIGKAKDSKEKTIAEKKGRFDGFVKLVNMPFTVLAATAKTDVPDRFRKPAAGMWEYLEAHLNGGIKIDRAKSFFVGDAAGRPKDHSDSDKVCAKTFGVPFFTEAECFKEQKYKALLKK